MEVSGGECKFNVKNGKALAATELGMLGPANQGKLGVVKEEIAKVNTGIRTQ